MTVTSHRRLLFAWLSNTIGASATLWTGLLVISTYIQPVSRRACNAAYVLWVLALYVSMMWLDTAIIMAVSFITAPEWWNPAQDPCISTIQSARCPLDREVPITQAGMDRSLTGHLEAGKDRPSCERQISRWEGSAEGQIVILEPLQALSTNMLTTFVIANIITGLINMAMDTNSVKPWTSRLIILVYVIAVVSVPSHRIALYAKELCRAC